MGLIIFGGNIHYIVPEHIREIAANFKITKGNMSFIKKHFIFIIILLKPKLYNFNGEMEKKIK